MNRSKQKTGSTLIVARYVATFVILLATMTSTVDGKPTVTEKDGVDRCKIVVEGEPRAAIVLGQHVTTPEKHAANELRKYIQQMTGADVPVISESDMGTNYRFKADDHVNLILIGKPYSNNTLGILNKRGLIKVTEPALAHDSFIVKTASDGRKNYLVLSGWNDRSVLYAVYHYLESVLHCGFFEDGEQIPVYADIIAKDLDISEESAFEYRWYPSYPGLAWSSFYFLKPEFEYLADYCAKKKINHAWWTGAGHIVPHYIRDISVREDPNSKDFRSNVFFDVELTKKLHKYLRNDLGLKVVGGVEASFDRGIVNDAFKKKHPNYKYLPMRGTIWGDWTTIDPATEPFVDWVASVIKNSIDVFGTDHLYIISALGGESMKILEDPVRDATIRGEWSAAMMKGIKKADPEAIWLCDGYALGWPMYDGENTKQFMEGIGSDDFVVFDPYSEGNPLRFKRNFFEGQKWILGITHSLAGWNYMHGSLIDTLDMYKEVFTDPNASRCVGASLSPERQMRNPLFFDFSFKVFWNPNAVNIDTFLKDYALRRYGEKSVKNMYECVKRLGESVYGPGIYAEHSIWTRNPIQLMLHSRSIGGFNGYESGRPEFEKRFKYIHPLREAVKFALKEKNNLRANKLYQIDLMDVCNQYLQELVNYYVYEVYDVYKAGDKDKFEDSAKILMQCMDTISMVLSSSEDRYLTNFAKLIERRWEASRDDFLYYNPDPNIDKRTLYEKAFDFVKGGASPNEYTCGDYYELNKHCYTKRMAYMIEQMRKNIGNENKHIDYDKVFRPYHTELFNAFKADPNNGIKDEEKYKGSIVEAAQKVLSKTVNLGPKK